VLAHGEIKLAAVTANTESKAVTKLSAEKPQLWDITLPKLHTMRTIVLAGGHEVDRVETLFGIRKIEWNAKQGFLINGHVLKLQGVCNHSDLGALGMAFNERAAERQLEILRAMGGNAIRTSHNPPAPQLLDLCDRMGFVVVDELFDCWKKGKTPKDYHLDYDSWHERDVANFVHRDRNHPSVILWSSGNEIKEQAKKDDNHERSSHLTELFHRADPTRPVAAGMHNDEALTNGFAQTVDVAGYNYKPIATTKPKNWLNPKTYLHHIRHAPDQPFFGAETASTLSSRGVYFFPVSSNKDGGFFQFQVSSYDHYGPPWANSPDIDFDSADRLLGLAGEFVWTGFDYLGEPTPYNKDKSNLLNFQNEAERAAMKAEMGTLREDLASKATVIEEGKREIAELKEASRREAMVGRGCEGGGAWARRGMDVRCPGRHTPVTNVRAPHAPSFPPLSPSRSARSACWTWPRRCA
jgi:beta-galactosidase